MTESNTAATVIRADLESGHWTKRLITLRFKLDAFDAAGALIEIGESGKILLRGLDGCEDRLYEAYVNRRWPTFCGRENARVFFLSHYLGENSRMLNRFINEVLPHLDVCYVGSEADWDDPRLYS